MRELLVSEAYVLHQRPYRESSALLELFLPRAGRIGAVARAVRGARATARRAILQPLQPLRVNLLRQGELAQLQEAEAAGPRLLPAGDAVLACLYVNELTLRLLPRNEPAEALFWSYASCLGWLEQGDRLGSRLRVYERDLLQAIGYGLQLSHDCQGEALQDEAHYLYRESSGAQPIAVGHPQAVSGRALLGLAAGEPPSGRDGMALRRLLRGLLEGHLGGRPLQSWGLLDALSGSGARAASARPAPSAAQD